MRQRQERAVSESRTALESAYKKLVHERGDEIWTKIEFCRLAGLKSTVPLHAARNSDLLSLFEQHNRLTAAQPKAVDSASNKESDLERVSSLAILLEAEVAALQKQNTTLKRRLKTLEMQLTAKRIGLHK